jgi:hypothetical protein
MLRLFIWEGNGISSAYHDDGTLVVLAETAQEARMVMREAVAEQERQDAEFTRLRDEYIAELDASGEGAAGWTKTERGQKIWALARFDSDFFDGSDAALDREPDRVVEIDGPKWVAFNGGGYD